MCKSFQLAAELFAVFMATGSIANAQAVLSVEPTAQTISAGSVFNIDVNISNVTNLYGLQFDLTFNPSLLSAVSSSEGAFLTTGGHSTFFVPGTNDNVNGIIATTADTLLSAGPGVSGSGELAAFTFDALKLGTSALGISNVLLVDTNINSIRSTTTGGSATVGSSTKAPEIDSASTGSALTLLLGGLAVLRGRKQSR
jgi:hypothetical protein